MLAGALLSVGSLAACTAQTPSGSETAQNQVRPFDYATTGLTAPEGAQPRPVLAVKVDDTEAGRPQQGTDRADLVVQEPVEGGLTRLIAFFESRRPESVGPVRSVRSTDLPLVQPVSATVVASGGSPTALAEFDGAGVELITETDPAFVRNPERLAPYNLYVDTTAIGRSAQGRLPRSSYLEFGDFDFPGGKTIAGLAVEFSPAATDRWVFSSQDGTWRREGDERQFPADTLLILGVELRDTGLKDAAGSAVPEAVVDGKGAGFLVTGDRVHIVKWSKRGNDSPYVLTTEAGLVVSVPPGRTWLTLLPKGTGKVSFL